MTMNKCEVPRHVHVEGTADECTADANTLLSMDRSRELHMIQVQYKCCRRYVQAHHLKMRVQEAAGPTSRCDRRAALQGTEVRARAPLQVHQIRLASEQLQGKGMTLCSSCRCQSAVLQWPLHPCQYECAKQKSLLGLQKGATRELQQHGQGIRKLESGSAAMQDNKCSEACSNIHQQSSIPSQHSPSKWLKWLSKYWHVSPQNHLGPGLGSKLCG